MRGTLTASEDRLWAYVTVPVVALLLASTLACSSYFTLIHSPLHWPFIFMFGVLTGYHCARGHSLIALMISHAVVDFQSFGWILFQRQGDTYFAISSLANIPPPPRCLVTGTPHGVKYVQRVR